MYCNREEREWQRIISPVKYKTTSTGFQIEWTYTFPNNERDILDAYFAFCFPYSYTEIMVKILFLYISTTPFLLLLPPPHPSFLSQF